MAFWLLLEQLESSAVPDEVSRGAVISSCELRPIPLRSWIATTSGPWCMLYALMTCPKLRNGLANGN